MTVSYSLANPPAITVPEEQRFFWAIYNTRGVYERGSPGSSWSGAYSDQSPQYLKLIGGTTSPLVPKIYPAVVEPTFTALPPDRIAAKSQIATAMAGFGTSNSVQAGDILYMVGLNASTLSQVRPHMAFVVGWGEYVSKWSEIVPAGSATSVPIYVNYAAARNAGIQVPVPYVVDHGPQGETGANYAFARPYYALWWTINGVIETRLDPDAQIQFLHLPTVVSLQVNPNGTATPKFRPTAPAFNPTQLSNGISPTP